MLFRTLLQHSQPWPPVSIGISLLFHGYFMLALVLTAFPSLTLPECAGGFIAAGLDLRKFELYDTWFDENSTVTLVQTGVYQGVDDIKEYMQFILPKLSRPVATGRSGATRPYRVHIRRCQHATCTLQTDISQPTWLRCTQGRNPNQCRMQCRESEKHNLSRLGRSFHSSFSFSVPLYAAQHLIKVVFLCVLRP